LQALRDGITLTAQDQIEADEYFAEHLSNFMQGKVDAAQNQLLGWKWTYRSEAELQALEEQEVNNARARHSPSFGMFNEEKIREQARKWLKGDAYGGYFAHYI
jgi:hypothetical protein